MTKYLIVGFLICLFCIPTQAQNFIKQGRKQIRRLEMEKRRTKRDFDRVGKMFSSEKKELTPEDHLSDTIIWEKDRYIPERGMVNDYAYLFQSIHGQQQKVLLDNTNKLNKVVWDSTTNTFYNRLDKINAIDDNYVVMGWHPYWMENDFQNYRYGLLSIISYFSYDVNPRTGGYNDPDAIYDWRTTAMIDSAQNNGVKVLLTVTSYGEKQNRDFFRDKMVWNSLIDSLKLLVNQRNANGIDLDFEQIPAANKTDYTNFVKKLSTELGNDKILTVQVPAYNNNNAIDFTALDDFVDYFIIQGYDYSFVECNSVPSPVSPLSSINTDCPCIINTYDYCIRNGMDPKKSILGLPAYGTEWTLRGNSWSAKATFDGYITYDDIMSDYNVNYQPSYDAISGSSYFMVKQGNSTKLIWYESQENLDNKFKWAIDHDMKGAAIWALGYDGKQPGIWNSIAMNFGMNPLQEIQPIAYDNGKLYSIMASFAKHRRAIGIGVVIIVYFFILGLFISLFDWRVREIFFQNFTYRAVFSGIIIVLSVLSIFLISGGSGSLFPLFIGLIVGALIVWLITNRYITYRDKLP